MKTRIVRFEIQDLLPIGLTFVVAGIGIVYGMSVMSDVRSDMCGDGQLEHLDGEVCYTCPNASSNVFLADQPGGVGAVCTNMTISTAQTTYQNSSNASAAFGGSHDFNASSDAIRGVAKIPEKMPLIATVIVAAIIIGILVRYLMVRFD